eukprot:TRINITY_DN2207_c1_g1_i1.p1 TRINITY_DN2207_c1_g1~~TRINITY_DN2207_c1_g1_i1.p1  ORF type:complete len:1600 (+),score=404.81 TRINITY_DN2207_c1_g1_i1:307-5106(+)
MDSVDAQRPRFGETFVGLRSKDAQSQLLQDLEQFLQVESARAFNRSREFLHALFLSPRIWLLLLCAVLLVVGFVFSPSPAAPSFGTTIALVVAVVVLLLFIWINVHVSYLEVRSTRVEKLTRLRGHVHAARCRVVKDEPYLQSPHSVPNVPPAPSLPFLLVRRDGKWARLPSNLLVSGDVVSMSTGDIVPARMRNVSSCDANRVLGGCPVSDLLEMYEDTPELEEDGATTPPELEQDIVLLERGTRFTKRMAVNALPRRSKGSNRSANEDVGRAGRNAVLTRHTLFLLEETPAILQVKDALPSATKRPVGQLVRHTDLFSRWLLYLFVVTSIIGAAMCLVFSLVALSVGDVVPYLSISATTIVLPLLVMSLPVFGVLVEAWGNASLMALAAELQTQAGSRQDTEEEEDWIDEFNDDDESDGSGRNTHRPDVDIPTSVVLAYFWRLLGGGKRRGPAANEGDSTGEAGSDDVETGRDSKSEVNNKASKNSAWLDDKDVLSRKATLLTGLSQTTVLCAVDREGVWCEYSPLVDKVYVMTNSGPKVLNRDRDPMIEKGLAFDDPDWKEHVSSLKPMGLNCLLTGRAESVHTENTLGEVASSLCRLGVSGRVDMRGDGILPLEAFRSLGREIGFFDDVVDSFVQKKEIHWYVHKPRPVHGRRSERQVPTAGRDHIVDNGGGGAGGANAHTSQNTKLNSATQRESSFAITMSDSPLSASDDEDEMQDSVSIPTDPRRIVDRDEGDGAADALDNENEQEQEQEPRRNIPNHKSGNGKNIYDHLVSLVVEQKGTGGLQLLSRGTPSLVVRQCTTYFDGQSLKKMEQREIHQVLDYARTLGFTAEHCVAFSYRPIHPEMKALLYPAHGKREHHTCAEKTMNDGTDLSSNRLRLPRQSAAGDEGHLRKRNRRTRDDGYMVSMTGRCDVEEQQQQQQQDQQPEQSNVYHADGEGPDTDGDDVMHRTTKLMEDQIFIGMVSLRSIPKKDAPRLVEALSSAGIRFSLFSRSGPRRSKQIAEKLGLETDWNCSISLQEEDPVARTNPSLSEPGVVRVDNNNRNQDNKAGADVAATEPEDVHDENCNDDDDDDDYDDDDDDDDVGDGGSDNDDYDNNNNSSNNINNKKKKNSKRMSKTYSTANSNSSSSSSSSNSDDESDEDGEYNTIAVGGGSGGWRYSGDDSRHISFSIEKRNTIVNDGTPSQLPKGCTSIREHLRDVDNVPLLVPLFTDCTSYTTAEMIRVYQENGDVVCCVGSCLNTNNTRVFAQADVAIGLEPQISNDPTYHSTKQRRESNGDGSGGGDAGIDGVVPEPVLTSNDFLSNLTSGALTSDLTCLPCDLVLHREVKFEYLLQLLHESRRLSSNTFQCLMFILACHLALLAFLLLTSILLLPSPLHPFHVVWLSLVVLPLLAVSSLFRPSDDMIMRHIKPKNVVKLPVVGRYAKFWGVYRLGPIVFVLLVMYVLALLFSESPTSPSQPFATEPSESALLGAQNVVALSIAIFFSLCALDFTSTRSPFTRSWVFWSVIGVVAQLLLCVALLVPSGLTALMNMWPAYVVLVLWTTCQIFIEIYYLKPEFQKWSRHMDLKARLEFDTKLGMYSPKSPLATHYGNWG